MKAIEKLEEILKKKAEKEALTQEAEKELTKLIEKIPEKMVLRIKNTGTSGRILLFPKSHGSAVGFLDNALSDHGVLVRENPIKLVESLNNSLEIVNEIEKEEAILTLCILPEGDITKRQTFENLLAKNI